MYRETENFLNPLKSCERKRVRTVSDDEFSTARQNLITIFSDFFLDNSFFLISLTNVILIDKLHNFIIFLYLFIQPLKNSDFRFG